MNPNFDDDIDLLLEIVGFFLYHSALLLTLPIWIVPYLIYKAIKN